MEIHQMGINPKKLKIVRRRFEEKLKEYSFKHIVHNEMISFYIIEDSLILLYVERLITEGKPIGVRDYSTVHIEEMTYNSLDLKYNHSKFVRELESELNKQYLSVYLTYTQFRGFDRWYWSEDTESTPEYINRVAPELELMDRYNQWDGVEYNFIVFEFKSISGEKEPLVAYTTKLPYDYVKEYVKKSIKAKRPYGGDNTRGHHKEILKVFRSWKRLSVKDRLEQKLTYFTISKNFKEKEEIWRYADKVCDKYKAGYYGELERYSYKIPDHKWISELRVFQLTKKLLPTKKVIFQHRPYFLKTSYGSQLSYDIYISKLNIAIEYQGKQHFEPVDFFGGSEAFIDTKRRDKLKKKLSHQEGVKLIYINYWEEITMELIEKRINQAMK